MLDVGVALSLSQVLADVVEVAELGGRAEGVDLGKRFGVIVEVEGLRGSFHGEEVRNIIRKQFEYTAKLVNHLPLIIFFIPSTIIIKPNNNIIPNTDNSAIFCIFDTVLSFPSHTTVFDYKS